MNLHDTRARSCSPVTHPGAARPGRRHPRGGARHRRIARRHGGDQAQVQAGGRGKAGGVKLAHTPDEAFEKARDILALTIKGCRSARCWSRRRRHRARALPLDPHGPAEEAAAGDAVAGAGWTSRRWRAPSRRRSSSARAARGPASLPGAHLMKPLFPDFKQAQQAADILIKLHRAFLTATARCRDQTRSRSRPRAA